MSDLKDELELMKAQMAALTARVYKLEQKAGTRFEQAAGTAVDSEPVAQSIPLPAGRSGPPEPPSIAVQRAGVPAAITTRDVNLEKKIGQYWLNRIGVVAILIGASYFLKYAFENNWIGEGGRVAIGLTAGIAFVISSERFRRHGHLAFSYSLKAIGIGILYLSLWAAFQLYHLWSAQVAFALMVVVTTATIVLALNQDAQALAALGLIGGFATPLLLSTGQNREIVLFSYTCILDAATLVIIIARPWRRLLWGSFLGTTVLYTGWYVEYYSPDQRLQTVFFVTIFAAIFASIPLVTPYEGRTGASLPPITPTLLPLINAAAFFVALSWMYSQETNTLAWCAVILAAVYWGISRAVRRGTRAEETNGASLIHAAIALGFITISIPLGFRAHWVTIGWLVESAALLWAGVKSRTELLRYFGIVTLALGIIRLLVFDRFNTLTLVFNWRFATYLIAVGILGGIVHFGGRHASGREVQLIKIAIIMINVLALVALTGEAAAYFRPQLAASGLRRGSFQPGGVSSYQQFQLARDFSYSALWLVYGAILMAIGFRKRSGFVRWQALALIAFTVGKVFIYDVAELTRGYRIVSFVALGAVLLGISFVYQRDWLKLSSRRSASTSQNNSF